MRERRRSVKIDNVRARREMKQKARSVMVRKDEGKDGGWGRGVKGLFLISLSVQT